MNKSVLPKHILSGLSLASILLLLSCTAVNQVRSVGKGNIGGEITLGGPMLTNLGAPIPIPNIYCGGRYGIRDDFDIVVHYNITGPIIPGIVLDLITGVHWVPIQPGLRTQTDSPSRGWGFGGSFQIQWVTDFKHGLVVFPTVECAGGWRHDWFNPFLGASLALDFIRPHDTKPPTVISPFIGCEFILKERSTIGVKCTIRDIAYNYYDSEVYWITLFNNNAKETKYGILDITIGISRIFGQSKKKKNNE